MKRLAILMLVVMLAVPAPVGAQDEVPIVEGVPFVLQQGGHDRAQVTVLVSKRLRRASGLGDAHPGQRWYMVRLRYTALSGRPVSHQFSWKPEGGRFHVARTGHRKRLPFAPLRRGQSLTGWVAWDGPSSSAGVRIVITSDDGTRYVLVP